MAQHLANERISESTLGEMSHNTQTVLAQLLSRRPRCTVTSGVFSQALEFYVLCFLF